MQRVRASILIARDRFDGFKAHSIITRSSRNWRDRVIAVHINTIESRMHPPLVEQEHTKYLPMQYVIDFLPEMDLADVVECVGKQILNFPNAARVANVFYQYCATSSTGEPPDEETPDPPEGDIVDSANENVEIPPDSSSDNNQS